MPENTPNLNLYKANPSTDGNLTFNIEKMLNDNWDKIDAAVIAKLLEAKGYTDTNINQLTAIIAKKADQSVIPTKTSQLQNDSGFITKDAIPSSLPASGGNAATVNNHTANATPSTAEKTDIIGMINEAINNLNKTATTSTNGLMSAADKTKLDSLSSAPGVYYYDTNSNGVTFNTKVAETNAYTGSVFSSNGAASTVIFSCVLGNIPRLLYNIGLRLKISNNTSTNDLISIKVNGTAVKTLKGTDFVDATNYCFRNISFENTTNSCTVSIETTSNASGITILLENVYVSQIGLSAVV